MAVHEIHERPDGVVEEYHEFTAEELASAFPVPSRGALMEMAEELNFWLNPQEV